MADYKAGDLNLSIQTISNDTIKSLDAVIERLSLIQKGLGTMSGFNRGGNPFIKKSTSGSRTEKTYSIGKLGGKYLILQKDIKRTEKSLRTITKEFDKHGKVLKKTTVDVDEYGNKITKIFGGGKKSTKNGGLFGFAKMGFSIYAIRRLGRFMGDLVQAGSDYNETLNLWQVAMRNNIDVADQFVNKMQKAYGISSKTIMNAQAVFKNMIGSLGQISDATAYALSEALVQMSADYASLYNRTLESAFQNMQSMLAGQVRPIRSAGLDITETTLYQYYQAIGGTKSMRQLNRTEKQLLSILAVYQQMGSAGALGDMSKTLNQYANQSRMLTEYWAELKTWSGLLLKDLIDQSGMLIYLNALLITATEIIKSIAKSRGIGDENFLTGMFESAELTNDEIDELQGKLLDFDKFRSLEGANASPLAIDEKLLQAITGYSSKIDQAQNAAQKLAETWLEFWLTDEGKLTPNAEKILDILKSLSIVVGILLGLKLGGWILKTATSLITLNGIMKLSTGLLLTGIIFAIAKAIEAFRDGDTAAGILATAIGTTLLGAFILLNTTGIKGAVSGISTFIKFLDRKNMVYHLMTSRQSIVSISGAFIGLGAAIAGALLLITNWSDMSTWQRIIGIVGVATTAILGLAMAFGVFNTSWSIGLATAGIVAGIAMIVASIATVKKDIEQPIQYAAVGASNLDSGTLFVAGEMGKTEAVYTGSNGKTNVANIQQMKTAYNQALNEWWRSARNDIPAFQGVSDSGIYTIVDGEAKRRGKKFANV